MTGNIPASNSPVTMGVDSYSSIDDTSKFSRKRAHRHGIAVRGVFRMKHKCFPLLAQTIIGLSSCPLKGNNIDPQKEIALYPIKVFV